MKLKVSLVLGLCFMFLVSLNAQINITVGLNGSYTLAETNNRILRGFNTINSATISEKMKELKFVSGLELGLRYGTENGAVTAGYTTSRRKRSAVQVLDTDEIIDTEINYSFGTYYVGFEMGASRFKIGSNIGRRKTKLKGRIPGSSEFEVLDSDSQWVSKFYFDIGARGNEISRISLRPYVDFAWGATDISNTAKELNDIDGVARDNFHMFGLAIVFFNGPQ